jgi:hypothetical protein
MFDYVFLTEGHPQCRSYQDFYTGKDFKRIEICNILYSASHLIHCLRHIHNPFEAASIKIQPKFNNIAGYLLHRSIIFTAIFIGDP